MYQDRLIHSHTLIDERNVMRERDIFDAALAIPEPEKRNAFLADACQGDTRLEGHLRNLLKAERGLGSFLESPGVAATMLMHSRPLAEGPGTVIGPYKLLEQIGEGGMGVVYMAEQSQPVRRKVALKIIKPGMDTKQVIARFEAERQALALMDHPNIAKVLDAGATDSGRPISSWSWSAACRSPSTATASSLRFLSGWSCSYWSAGRCSTPTRRASSTATSSPPTSW
jgi:hypothetical protein